MSRAIITICFITLTAFVCQNTKGAEDKNFYSDGNIMPGEQWSGVSIYNDGTTVNMSGGYVDGIGTFNASRLNISDGHVNTLNSFSTSTVNISGGYVYSLFAEDNSFVSFSSNAQSLSLGARESSILLVNGGETDYLRAGQSSTINLHAGTIFEYLNAWDLSIINIYGKDIIYDPIGGSWYGGQLRGLYLDGSPLLLDLYDAQTYNHINFIPEPTSLILLGLGALVLRRNK